MNTFRIYVGIVALLHFLIVLYAQQQLTEESTPEQKAFANSLIVIYIAYVPIYVKGIL